MITKIELLNIWKFFILANFSRKIVTQIKKSPCKKYTARGIWTTHYTQSLWEKEEDIKQFMLSGAHGQSMKHTKSLSQYVKFKRVAAEDTLPWSEAKSLINEA